MIGAQASAISSGSCISWLRYTWTGPIHSSDGTQRKSKYHAIVKQIAKQPCRCPVWTIPGLDQQNVSNCLIWITNPKSTSKRTPGGVRFRGFPTEFSSLFHSCSPRRTGTFFSFTEPVLQLSVVCLPTSALLRTMTKSFATKDVIKLGCQAQECDQTGMSNSKLWSKRDVKHTAVIKLDGQTPGCDQTGRPRRIQSKWDVKHQDVAKQKRTRNWNPSCHLRYFSNPYFNHRWQESNYLWTTRFST